MLKIPVMNLERRWNGTVPLVLCVDWYFSIVKAGKIWCKMVFWCKNSINSSAYSSRKINWRSMCLVAVREEKASWTELLRVELRISSPAVSEIERLGLCVVWSAPLGSHSCGRSRRSPVAWPHPSTHRQSHVHVSHAVWTVMLFVFYTRL